MIPAQAATQKIRRPAMCRSYSGLRGAPLPQDERDQRGERDRRQAQRQRRPCPGTGAKLIARISAPTSSDGQDAAEVVDRLGRLVDVRRARGPRP